MIRRILWVAAAAALVLGGIRFSEKNATPVAVHYFFGESAAVKLWAVIAGAFTAGFLVAAVLMFFETIRNRWQVRSCRKQITRLEEEIRGLRNLPLVARGDVAEQRTEASEPELAYPHAGANPDYP